MKGLLANARDLAINRVAQPLLAFLLVVAVGRIGSDLLGAYTIVTVWFIILQTLPMLGLGPFLGRELVIHRDGAAVIVGSAALLGMGASAVLALLVPGVLAAAGYPPEVRNAVLLSAASMFPSVVIFVAETYLVSIHDTVPVGLVSLVENVFRVGASLAALALGHGVAALFVAVLAGRLGAAAWYLWRLRSARGPGLTASPACVAALLRECPLYLLHTVVFLVVSRADFVVLSVAVPAGGVAPYAVAYKFVEFGLLLVAAFVGAIFPHLARASQGEASAPFGTLAVRSTKLLLVVAVPACALLYLNAEGVVGLLFPRQRAEAVPLMRLLLPALLLSSFKTLSSTILLSEARPRAELAGLGAGAVSYLVLLAWLVPRHGAFGAAVATLIEAVVQGAVRAAAVARHFSLAELRAERFPALAAAATGLAGAVLLADSAPLGALARLLIGGALAAAFGAFVVRAGIVRFEEPGPVEPSSEVQP